MESTVGNRLLPALVDEFARSTPDRVFGIIPKGQAVSDGFREVTFRTLAHAVDAMSWWIEEHIGKREKKETIAYMGGNDIRYYIFILACAKTGYTPFLPSTRLSDEAYQHVLSATNCSRMLFSRETQRRTLEIKAFRPRAAFVEIPSTVELLDTNLARKHYPFTKTYEAMEDEVAFLIHSSGTTGMPKPVPLTHGFLGAWDHGLHIIPTGRKSVFYNDLDTSALLLSVTPNFHMMGLASPIESILHGTPFVSSPDVPLSTQVLADTIQATKPTIAILPPSIVEEMSHSPAALEALKIVKYVILAGAPLDPETGEHLRKYARLRTTIGSSEMGMVSSLAPESEENWRYFEWNPAYGADMQYVGDGLYELVILRQEAGRVFQGIFHTFPHLNEYHTKDLFVRHPENPKLWTYHGRLDDVIVLSNGEKLNPVMLETIIEGHPLVSRALLVGEKKFQSALLIQPNWTENGPQDEKEYINNVWPTIQQANETVPKYGRVMRSHVRLASRDKPFMLTPKGTTQRRAVNNDYKREIDAIYATAADEVEKLPSTLDLPNLSQWLQGKVASLLDRQDIAISEDLYAAGLDSLQTVQLAKTLTTALTAVRSETISITQQQIYANPTIDQLAAVLLAVLNGGEVTRVSRTEKIANLVLKYTSDLPSESQRPPQPPRSSTVILTGSTGSLGTYLLNTLLKDPTVSKIYCLNRSDAQPKQEGSFKEKGLDHSPLADRHKVEFIKVSFGEKSFGLQNEKYKELVDTVNVIIHNAWKVNFNHPVESFEDPHLKGVREFVEFSLQSRYRAHIAFVSSVSTIGGWTATMGPIVPELPMETPEAVLEQGYGESKHVGERICLEASRQSLVPTSIFRVGQIAGPTTAAGLWNPHEWIPILLKTSKATGMVPNRLGSYVIDWIPVDTLATITIEILKTRLQTQSEHPHAVFHLMNPSKTSWSSLIPAIQEKLSVKPVELTAWLDELGGIKNPSDQDLLDKPALKLLLFFRGLATGETMSTEISVERAKEASSTIASLGPVSPEQMVNWLGQWRF